MRKPKRMKRCWWWWWRALAWTLALVLWLLQSAERASYYLSVPVAVDVEHADGASGELPEIAVCTAETRAVCDLAPIVSVISLAECVLRIYSLLGRPGTDPASLWEATNMSSLIVTADILDKHDGHRRDRLLHRNIVSSLGMCSGFRAGRPLDVSRESVLLELSVIPESCPSGIIFFSVQESEHTLSLRPRSLAVAELGIVARVALQPVVYHFVNRPDRPCDSEDKFWKCLEECLVRRYDSQFSCRLPFVDPSGLHPSRASCTSSTHALDVLYRDAMELYLTTDAYNMSGAGCGCLPSCDRRVVLLRAADRFGFLTNVSSFSLTLLPEDRVKERPTYDAIALLCDLGGNLGLYLGVSLLAVCDFLYRTYSSWRSYGSVRSRRGRAVIRRCRAVLRSRAPNKKTKEAGKRRHPLAVVVVCLLLLCSHLILLWLSYWEDKSTTIVSVAEEVVVRFPSVTVCGVSRRIERLRHKSSVSGCALLDLVNATRSAEKLWQDSDGDDQFLTVEAFGKMLWKLVVRRVNRSSVPLPEGMCTRFRIAPATFAGTYTAFLFLARAHECNGEFSRQVYIAANELDDDDDDDDDDAMWDPTIDPMTIPASVSSGIVLEAKRVEWRRECTSRSSVAKCRRRCLVVALRNDPRAPRCSLPFAPNASPKWPSCRSSSSSWLLRRRWLSAGWSCAQLCPRPCRSRLLSLQSIHEKSSRFDFDMQAVAFACNVVETVREVASLSTGKVLCDVGAAVGLWSGCSLVGVLLYVLRFLRRRTRE